jgi:hypothetical protein
MKSVIPKLTAGNELKQQIKKERKMNEVQSNSNSNNINDKKTDEFNAEYNLSEKNTLGKNDQKLNDSLTLNLNELFNSNSNFDDINEHEMKTEFTKAPEDMSTKEEIAKLVNEIKKLREEVSEFKNDNSEFPKSKIFGLQSESQSIKGISLDKNKLNFMNNNLRPFSQISQSETNLKILGNNDLNLPGFNYNDSILSQEQNTNFPNTNNNSPPNIFQGLNTTMQNNASFDAINNVSSQKIQENNLKDISSYRSNSVINKNKPKNFNLPSNNIYNQNQLYKKPINIKEKNNQGQNIYEAKKIINYDLKEEEEENKDEKSIYKSKIEERKERLKEMKRKIEEINRDIKKTEQYYYQTQRKSNKQNKDNIYNNNVKTSRHTFNRMNINYQDENISNEDINPDSYKVQIIDTDINRNDNKENDDLNKRENIFNKKNKYSNINIYRNSKVKYLHENRSEVTHIDDKYIKKKEKDFYFQTPNLKKGKFKNSIFKNYANNAINKSNGQINKTSNKNKSENTYIS